jgi:hypothetical protein
MSLRIFISSVSGEFDEERKALMHEIISLQELFSAMEFFNSDPSAPAEYCISEVEKSGLYLGIIGQKAGSIEETRNQTYTEIEYQAAQNKGVPCLIYISKNAFDGNKLKSEIPDHQKSFINKLRKQHISNSFSSVTELRILFLRSFIKMLRDGEFQGVVPLGNKPISADVLHTITSVTLSEQIKSVGQEKYIPEIYTNREAEIKLKDFISFDEEFKTRVDTIISKLENATFIGATYQWNEDLSHFKQVIRDGKSPIYRNSLKKLEEGFYFEKVKQALHQIDEIIVASEADLKTRIRSFLFLLSTFPYTPQTLHLQDIQICLHELCKGHKAGSSVKNTSFYTELLKLFPYYQGKTQFEEQIQPCYDLLLELNELIDEFLRNCLVLVDRAGSGKTNIVCHTAEQLIKQNPVILLSGQMEVSNEFGIALHIQHRLEAQLGGMFNDWINRIGKSLQESSKWLYIIVDGINENNNLRLFVNLLGTFLPQTTHSRIKLVLTCRDLSWDLFRDKLKPYIFRNIVSLDYFSNVEWRKAIRRYFDKFKLQCILDPEAEKALKNPLLLRFFCEANEGKKLGHVSNIKLVNIFDLYIARISRTIAEKFPYIKESVVLQFLMKLSNQMWSTRQLFTVFDDLEGAVQPIHEYERSLYQLLLGDNIIAEASEHRYSTRRNVRFTYDAFMEYILARNFFEKVLISNDKEGIPTSTIREIANSINVFPPGFGAVLFLDQIMDCKGLLINEFLKECFKSTSRPPLIFLIYAFAYTRLDSLDIELVSNLELLHKETGIEYKELLARITMKILPHIRNHDFAKRYVNDVLEAKEMTESIKAADKNNIPLAKLTDGMKGLPPARYHYSDEAKLSAMAFLINEGTLEKLDIIHYNIERLGAGNSNNALRAMGLLDCVGDEPLFRTLDRFSKINLPEYRIFSAWLLRNRFGSEPARFLSALLTDQETRVHEFTFRLFETRCIEDELLNRILSQSKNVRTWHLVHFIKIFGKRSQFQTENKSTVLGIISLLKQLQAHEKAHIRLEAQKACGLYREYF